MGAFCFILNIDQGHNLFTIFVFSKKKQLTAFSLLRGHKYFFLNEINFPGVIKRGVKTCYPNKYPRLAPKTIPFLLFTDFFDHFLLKC